MKRLIVLIVLTTTVALLILKLFVKRLRIGEIAIMRLGQAGALVGVLPE